MYSRKGAGDMAFQLWELESRNCVAEFASQGEALGAVRAMTLEHGEDAAASLLLVHEARDGTLKKIAAGEALLLLAREALGGASPTPPVKQPIAS
jgi:hypothetical protein